jgi:MFS family permease
MPSIHPAHSTAALESRLAAPATRPTDAGRTLRVATAATMLVLAVFSALVVTIADSARALGTGATGEAWALSGMSLGLAAALLTAGAVADEVGHGKVLTWTAGLLALGSVSGALAPNILALVGSRVLQGVAGGGVLASALGSIGRAFPAGASRTRATAIWGASVGAGITTGPLAAAGLQAAFGWRSGFWVEAAAAAGLMIRASGASGSTAARSERADAAGTRRLDIAGMAALASTMVVLTSALVESRGGWSRPTTLFLLALAALLLATFTIVELTRRRPMLDPRLLGRPQFLGSVAGALFLGLAVVGLMSYSATFLQRGLGLSVLGSAGLLTAWSATSTVVAIAARSLPARIGTRTRLVIGLLLAGGGEMALTGLSDTTGWRALLPGLVIAGVGTGIANAALGRIAVESVPPSRAGMGSGANNTARYLGGATGVALVVSVASATGTHGPVEGWNHAAFISAVLCGLGAAAVASCRPWRR